MITHGLPREETVEDGLHDHLAVTCHGTSVCEMVSYPAPCTQLHTCPQAMQPRVQCREHLCRLGLHKIQDLLQSRLECIGKRESNSHILMYQAIKGKVAVNDKVGRLRKCHCGQGGEEHHRLHRVGVCCPWWDGAARSAWQRAPPHEGLFWKPLRIPDAGESTIPPTQQQRWSSRSTSGGVTWNRREGVSHGGSTQALSSTSR